KWAENFQTQEAESKLKAKANEVSGNTFEILGQFNNEEEFSTEDIEDTEDSETERNMEENVNISEDIEDIEDSETERNMEENVNISEMLKHLNNEKEFSTKANENIEGSNDYENSIRNWLLSWVKPEGNRPLEDLKDDSNVWQMSRAERIKLHDFWKESIQSEYLEEL
ncbi:1294_t:CDS:1, partial [Dentiscutata heterogama]